MMDRPRSAIGVRTLIMGIVNVTPDSFHPHGRFHDSEAAANHCRRLLSEGADIVDIGGESSRPGADPVDRSEEQRRIMPVLEALMNENAFISVDTYHADTAQKALAAGASMINDITAFQGDPDMAEVVAEAGCECVIMHMKGTPKTMQKSPRYDNVIDEISAFFEERVAHAQKSGVADDAIWLDPGFGFGKTVDHNLEILRRLREFKRFGFPVLIGTSNKSTIGTVLDAQAGERAEGTAATVAVAITNGVDCVRVHDVKAMARVARMTDAIVR